MARFSVLFLLGGVHIHAFSPSSSSGHRGLNHFVTRAHRQRVGPPSVARAPPSMMSSVADVPATYSREERKLLERGAWLPIGSAGALRDLTPTRVEIAGKKLAVWRPAGWKPGTDAEDRV